MNDKTATIEELKMLTRKFTLDRNWDKFHNVKNLASTAVTEASELLEIFRFRDEYASDRLFSDPEMLEAITDEMADVVFAIMRIADRYDIDFAKEFERKVKKSVAKYPIEKFKKDHIDKVGWINIKNNKVLGARSKGKIPFYIPGGKREGYESDLETLAREIKEELSVAIKPDTAKYIGQFEAPAHGKHTVSVVIKAYTADFEGDLLSANEVDAIGWLEYSDILNEKTGPVDKKILTYLHEQGLIV